ncbi:MAG TPA: aspartate aminotransferase family protein [Thermoanaerobaculia bacterium]|nr:aspartate aminotransferase family protein [Thermoanaerobaculia bacterium]
MHTSQMAALRLRAEQSLLGGVASGWNHLSLTGPIYFKRAHGAYLYDVDGRRYIDYFLGWGSLLLGHDPPGMRDALLAALQQGFCHEYETESQILLAEKICSIVPCAERVRLANSGTEATMYAVRVARSRTGKNKIIKFEGHFHGLHDTLLFATDSSPRLGALQEGGEIEPVPGSSGVPSALGELVVVLPFNDTEAFARAVERHHADLAAVIMEPIAMNLGCIAPDRAFLDAVRRITSEKGIVLIFDEVLTGFRVALGGAQEYYGVSPDLACYGKALGCGMSIAAVAGRKDIMEEIYPPGQVQMGGTNSGRILAVAGALAALDTLSRPGFYERLSALTDRFVAGMRSLTQRYDIPSYVEGIGGRIGVYFGLQRRPRNMRDVLDGWNQGFHNECYLKALEKGLYGVFHPLPFSPESITLCAAHTPEDIDDTLDKIEAIFKQVPYTRTG